MHGVAEGRPRADGAAAHHAAQARVEAHLPLDVHRRRGHAAPLRVERLGRQARPQHRAGGGGHELVGLGQRTRLRARARPAEGAVGSRRARPGREGAGVRGGAPPTLYLRATREAGGRGHSFWNAGDEEARFLCEVLPALGFERLLSKSQQEVLNPEGINCFRYFSGRGNRLWGARLMSSDPEWKYVNLRRYFAFLEHSIDRGTQWAVFEPNGERLWASVRGTIDDFLLELGNPV